MLKKFLDDIAARTGTRYTPAQFGKMIIEAAKAAEEETANEEREAEKQMQTETTSPAAPEDKEVDENK